MPTGGAVLMPRQLLLQRAASHLRSWARNTYLPENTKLKLDSTKCWSLQLNSTFRNTATNFWASGFPGTFSYYSVILVLNPETTPPIFYSPEKRWKDLHCFTDGKRDHFVHWDLQENHCLTPWQNTPWRNQAECFYNTNPHLKYTPQSFTVPKFWWHLEKVVILEVQRPELLHLLQLQRVYSPHLVVTEQDGLQCGDAVKDTGKHFKSSEGREKSQQ